MQALHVLFRCKRHAPAHPAMRRPRQRTSALCLPPVSCYLPSPSAAGDADYSPLFVVENGGGEVYNGPIVASGASLKELRQYCDGIPNSKMAAARKVMHDKIASICPDDSSRGGTVTLELTPGFSFARPVLYLRCASPAAPHPGARCLNADAACATRAAVPPAAARKVYLPPRCCWSSTSRTRP
jgi:hypothetical protein